MSLYLNPRVAALTPYVPGEQPRDRAYCKLNTNESPFPPSPLAQRLARQEAGDLRLYSDPAARDLKATAASVLGVGEDQILFTNGSDEILYFAFVAYCGPDRPAIFPDVTYGFYPVFADLCGVPTRTVPLKEDFTLDPADYKGLKGTLFLANPNAPTGLALSRAQVEALIAADPDRMVVVDEAYVDFGGESVLDLIDKYDNLLVTRTFSKSRSLAGARLGFGAACAARIAELERVRCSTNPYNVNRMTLAAGIGALLDTDYFERCRAAVIATREKTAERLRAMGFTMPASSTNFLFIRHPKVGGAELAAALREQGVLVRHFDAPRLKEYNRVTVGSEEEMDRFFVALTAILEVRL